MSDISTGDLVRIVGGCCKHADESYGEHHVVINIIHGITKCVAAGRFHAWMTKQPVQRLAVLSVQPNGDRRALPFNWLKKVPPLEHLESAERQEREPA